MKARPAMLAVEATQRSPAEVVALVVDAVAGHYGLRAADILGRRGNACFVSARQIAVFLAQEFTGESNVVIGTLFGLDASTVSYTGRKVERLEKEAPKVAAGLTAIRGALRELDPELGERPPRATEARRRFLQNTGAEALTPEEFQLQLLLKDLRRALITALRTDPGAILASLRRACHEINSRDAKP